MLQRIWLHIGAEKTGTTTIQQSLKLSRNALADRGILFPRSVGDFNHTALAAYGMDDDRGIEELRISSGLRDTSELGGFRDRIRTALADEAGSGDFHTMIFSNEHCSSRLKKPAEIARLRDLCLGLCRDVKVVLYIRSPAEFYASWYSTAIASGNTFDFPWPLPDHLKAAADWARMIRKWEAAFGAGSLIVRRMDRAKMINEDLLDDFYATVGLPEVPYAVPERKNEALPLNALIFLRELNKVLPRIKDGKFNPERANVVDVLRTWPEKERFHLNRTESQELEDMFEYSYETIRETYFPQDETLFSNGGKSSETSCRQRQLSLDDAVRMASFLWTSKASRN